MFFRIATFFVISSSSIRRSCEKIIPRRPLEKLTFLFKALSCPALCSDGELVVFSDANSTILFIKISEKPAGCFCFSASGRVCHTRDRKISSLKIYGRWWQNFRLFTVMRVLLTSESGSSRVLGLVLRVEDLIP